MHACHATMTRFSPHLISQTTPAHAPRHIRLFIYEKVKRSFTLLGRSLQLLHFTTNGVVSLLLEDHSLEAAEVAGGGLGGRLGSLLGPTGLCVFVDDVLGGHELGKGGGLARTRSLDDDAGQRQVGDRDGLTSDARGRSVNEGLKGREGKRYRVRGGMNTCRYEVQGKV